MSTMFCPFCHVKTSITERSSIALGSVRAAASDRHGFIWFIGECNGCGRLVLACEQNGVVYPNPLPSPTAPEILQAIRENLDEAKQCSSVGAWRATAVMCRRALQMACIDKGANASDNLVAQIKHLKTTAVITADLYEWATIVRWVGNDGAHPGGAEIDKEDAENMLDLTEQFLHVLYVAPAKAAAHRAKLGR